jgi:hypothetical protein
MNRPKPPNPKFPEQDENGVDLSIIRSNLRLTPLERVEKNYNGMKAMLELRALLKPIPRGDLRKDATA